MRPLTYLALAAAGGVLASMFWPDDPDAPAAPDVSTPELRARAIALCSMYLPCNRGDAHFREICKDFTPNGVSTTCGFLTSWVLWRLGCRDPRLVNRTEPEAGLSYTPGRNIADIVQGGALVGARRPFTLENPPKPGDLLYFGAVDASGGISHEHVAVCVSYPEGGQGKLLSYDLGGSFQPEGRLAERPCNGGNVVFLNGGRRLIFIIDLSLIPFDDAPDMTDHTDGVA